MRSKKAIYNVISNLLLQFIIVLYGFIVPKIIISSFGSDVNGLISSITQFLAYISLLESGIGPVVKASLYKPIANNDKNKIINILYSTEKFFKKIAYIFLIYILLMCVFYPFIVNKDFDYLYTVSLIVIIGISTFAEYFFGMTYRLFLQSKQKTYIISLIQILTYILAILLIVIMAKLGCSIQSIKLISSIVFLLRPILQNVYVKKKYELNFRTANSEFKMEQKWDGLAQHIAAVIHGNTDITVLTLFSSLSEVSVYSVYYLIITGVKKIIQSFTSGIDATFGDMIAKKEKANLREKFCMYEVLYNTINTIVFSSSVLLIVPFVTVYTKGITDANYIRYWFGTLIVISEYIWAIRLPYSSIILAAGHFKETRIGAWIECIINIVLSVILVWRYGIIGVAIGTIVAMLMRTMEFIYHCNKYILDRSIFESIKKILLLIIETIIIIAICNKIIFMNDLTYFNWFYNAVIVCSISCLIVLIINCMFYSKEFKKIFIIFKGIFKKK